MQDNYEFIRELLIKLKNKRTSIKKSLAEFMLIVQHLEKLFQIEIEKSHRKFYIKLARNLNFDQVKFKQECSAILRHSLRYKIDKMFLQDFNIIEKYQPSVNRLTNKNKKPSLYMCADKLAEVRFMLERNEISKEQIPIIKNLIERLDEYTRKRLNP